jgi:hypothetical protein
MGGGSWTTDTYTSRAAAKSAAGKSTFDYSDTARRTGRYTVHPDLDPAWTAGDASPFAGKPIRESRDSDEHPESLPIAVLFDVTGSMGHIPMVLQKKLPKLYSILLQKGYVEHPQILYGAIGDATCDRVPLQIGQFESDNRADDNLENFILEGGGGNQTHESYELGAYFMARHTATDAWEKRGKKGYLFFIGDERNYPKVNAATAKKLIGVGPQANIPTEEIYRELQEKWEVYFLFAAQGSYREEIIVGGLDRIDGDPTWRMLLGQNALILDDADAVCETIAVAIGLAEGAVDLDEGIEHLKEIGTDSATTTSVSVALSTVAATAPGKTAVASGTLPAASGDDDIATL